jgi:aminopeptidase N
MREGTAPLVRREDYAAPPFWIRKVDLTFELEPAKTLVINRMQVERNADVPAGPLKLHGKDITLTRCLVNGESVSFRHEEGLLVIDNVPPGSFALEIRNTCAPEKNTQLSGLYTSGGGFFTQCEAEGFRRITYFLDRPDVMAEYSVLLRANKAAYPVLLSNGNLVEQGELDNGRHFARWHDPFPKPSYLFALVAADLVAREQRIRSRSGKDHLIQVYVRRGDLDKTEYAMSSLVASIVWDEARFGLPLDLERFMVVAVGDFNMGAMENKGLNIFNTRYILANAATATDADSRRSNRWSADEYPTTGPATASPAAALVPAEPEGGLTVFRDRELKHGHGRERGHARGPWISDVRNLRQVQFAEDAGRWRIRCARQPQSRSTTSTPRRSHDKGAEVVRMMQTLVGRDGFARGTEPT